jgi:FMN phosphatase YigB (HAD superfamily)
MANNLSSNIKYIYFDFDNVIAHRSIDRSKKLAEVFGIENATSIRNFYISGFKSNPELNNRYISIKDASDEQAFYEELFSVFLKSINMKPDPYVVALTTKDFIKTPFIVFENVKESLTNLAKDYKVGILTNGLPSRHQEIKDTGLEDLFSNIIISSDYQVEKPDHRMYDIAIEKSEMIPESIALVDDDTANLDAATAMGFGQAVLFNGSFWN